MLIQPISLSLAEKLQFVAHQKTEETGSTSVKPIVDPFAVFLVESKVMAQSWSSFGETTREIAERGKEADETRWLIKGALRASEKVASLVSTQRIFFEITHAQNVTFLSHHYLSTAI